MELNLRRQSRAATDEKQSSSEAQNWTCPVKDSYASSDTWYRYLNSLYCEFSEYRILLAKKSYNVADIGYWGLRHVHFDPNNNLHIEAWKHTNEDPGIEIDRSNFESFLNKTETYDIAEQSSIRNMTITDTQLRELNHVLDLTIKDKMHISCKEPHMFIKGNNIIFSHLKLNILSGTVDNTCRHLLYSDRLKYMNIFALNTVFIDDDLKEKMNLITVIAPKWKIIGGRRIELNGKDAEEVRETVALANQRHINGKDGKPGKPGEPGGNFFGIGEEFIYGGNLIIFFNGGHGSRGQDGGNGANGKHGISPTVPSGIRCKASLCDDDKRINLFKCEKIERMHPPSPVFKNYLYTMFGEQGSRGGNGGNGGKGGEGGHPGDIVFFELNAHSEVTQIKNFGQNGIDGRGGLGGVGGETGNEIQVKCEPHRHEWELVLTHSPSERAESGTDGIDGENIKNMQLPREPTYIARLDKAKTINQYKSFLRENIGDPFRHFFLKHFLNRLENHHDVKSVYDTLEFVDELKSLEEQFHNLNRNVNLLHFYQSLLDRISEYAQNLTEVEDSSNKKVLGYLYTATLGRIHNLEDDLESNLIIDVAAYLESVKNDIEMLKDMENVVAKGDIINKYKQEYKDEIDIKIKDAKDFISNEIRPEIDNIETDIENQIETLMNEVIYLQKQSRIESKKIRQKQEEFEKLLVLQGIFGSLKIFGQVVSFIGTAGAVAGSVIDISSSLAETFILDIPSGSNSTIPNLEQSVTYINSLKDQIKTFSDQKASGLKQTLENVSQEIDKHPDVFPEIFVKVSDIKSRLDTIGRDKLNTIKEVRDLEIELKTTLQSQKNELINDQEGTDNEKTKTAVVVIDKLQKTIQLSSVTVETYTKYVKSRGKLAEVQKAIQQNEDKFDKLKQYEDRIYDTIVPMLENMGKDLDDVISQTDTKSKVVLDVTKWKVKNTLKDMILQMQELTRDFKVQGNLVRCIEKLQEAMVSLINVQGHIQDYQKDQFFSNFIAGVSSISLSDIDISNNPVLERHLGDALQDLEVTLRASIVTQRHKVAIDAFKQFVFPFAHMYFKGSMLPSYFELDNKNGNKLDNLVSGVITHINHIQSNLEEYKISVKKQDGCIGTGEFKSEYVSSKPFLVWKNEEHKNMISKLLSGEEVIVKADIMQYAPPYDAIKFNDIHFGFKSKDVTVQSKINNDLKRFWITATHLGNSYYRYEGKIYLMTTANHKIWYFYEKNTSGEPVSKSISYDKIKNGDFMPSPYASWKIKLVNATNEISFKDLEIYKHEVDIELGGNGHYLIGRDINCLELMVDRYYKAVDDDNSVVELDADDFLPLLMDGAVARSRRGINQETGNKESATINQEHLVIQNDHPHTEYEKSKADSSGWFSWFRFPKSSIMPGAEASILEDDVSDLKERTTVVGKIITPLSSGIKSLKDAVTLKTTKNITDYDRPTKISNNYIDYAIKENISMSSNNLAISLNGNENSNDLEAVASVDINGNLALGQILVHKVFGNIKSISGTHYASPEQKKLSNISKLSSRILPIVNNVSVNDYEINDFVKNYRKAPQWYKDLYKEEFEEIIKQN